MQNEFGSKGLVVLALSDEDPKLVGDYVDQMNIASVRVASGTTTIGEYDIPGYPTTALIDTQGKVIWMGHPGSLSDGMVEDALKGAKPFNASFLALTPSEPATGRLSAVAKSMETGKLGKALGAAKAFDADVKATAEEKAAATKLAGEIEAYLAVLNQQAEQFVKSRDLVKAVLVHETLAKEFAGMEVGNAAKARIDEIKKDKVLAKELAAAEAFEKVREQASKLGSSKARDKYKEFAEKNKGTRAGERAAGLARKKD